MCAAPVRTGSRAEAVPAPDLPARRRLREPERRSRILEAAAELFAERGFGVSTRDIAKALGVTQALLYRYYPSKHALVEQVLAADPSRRWDPAWTDLLRDRRMPLAERLACFYEAYRVRSTRRGMRLWMRANLDGVPLATAYTGPLSARVFGPIVEELRHDAGLPPLARRRMMRGEREIAMQLHASVVFSNIRAHVYESPPGDRMPDVVRLYVGTWLPGALLSLRALHAGEGDPSMRVTVAHRG